jgi:hypothetical protein
VAELYVTHRAMERRVVTVMVKKIRQEIDNYPKLSKWLNRPFATQQVKVYVYQLKKEKKI